MQVTWYFDVISPFAYLALGEVETLAETTPIVYKPILFAGLLKHHGQLGPAEIQTKRLHTYRLCIFEAQRRGVPFAFPPSHPFNPVRALRFLCEVGAESRIVRRVMEHIWRDGCDPNEEGSWGDLMQELKVRRRETKGDVSSMDLRGNTQEAVALGAFGVPTLAIGCKLFWGVDALPLARAYIDDPNIFERGEMARAATIENPFSAPSRMPLVNLP
ncbi:2-hydroxychromene-2-carboxylate isomerase [uncultured Jannaschia sp.]|uniref:2-hydroxychromene-2-carboxylate isomerase n=1 Tax=uncultured Jannaschia sp. TaxID=293347 RepID=UPI0026060B4A|nr:DsbA family protein [uncultured Jannaschia sp.]